MAFLRVSKPSRPLKYVSSDRSRLVYRVILDDGTVLSLPEMAKKLAISYPTLAARVHRDLAIIGDHDSRFFQIIAEVRQATRVKRPKQRCKTCGGRGWHEVPEMPAAQEVPSA